MNAIERIDGGDVIVIGAGLAGAFAAHRLLGLNVTWIATRATGDEGSSAYAQGGIAAALGADDSPALHLADTIRAGAGLVDQAAALQLVTNGPALVRHLAEIGVPFDRDQTGALALGQEAAHNRRRIVHAGGDQTGAQIMRKLAPIAASQPGVNLLSGMIAESLVVTDGRIAGLIARRQKQQFLISAPCILLATGGIGALYRVTTNPPDSAGEGLGMAARAGAMVADPEFVQFHPTALDVARDPAPLASEALRGEGAWLINDQGSRFCFDHHADGELAPRDVVARAIWSEIAQGRKVFLDTRQVLGSSIETRFPTIFHSAMEAGIDARIAPLPVAPAAHYHMGGLAVDAQCATSVTGLWAAGEVAATGVHGANRLASNSLLETLTTADAAAASIRDFSKIRSRIGAVSALPGGPIDPVCASRLRAIMSAGAGGLRDASGMQSALDAIDEVETAMSPNAALANRLAAMRLVLGAALMRRESRGAHARSDFPQTAALAQRRFLTLADVTPARHATRRAMGA